MTRHRWKPFGSCFYAINLYDSILPSRALFKVDPINFTALLAESEQCIFTGAAGKRKMLLVVYFSDTLIPGKINQPVYQANIEVPLKIKTAGAEKSSSHQD